MQRSNDKKQRLIGAAAFYLEFALQTRLFIALSQPVVCESAAKNFFGSRSFLQKFLWEYILTEKLLTVRNRAGIHARPAALIAQTANKFASEVLMEKDGTVVNAKPIMGVITIAAGYNTAVTVKAEGADAEEAVKALETLFENKFED